MKNFAAKLFLTVVAVSGLSAAAMANAATLDGSGSIVRYFVVEGYDLNSHKVYFAAGTTVLAKATGDGSTDLDMYVMNSEDEIIVKDVRESTDGYVKFTARKGGYYYIAVDNNGGDDNLYKLEVNY